MKRRITNKTGQVPKPSQSWGRLRAVPAGLVAFLVALKAVAAPLGMTVQQGSVNASQTGPRLDITASHNSVINWQSFNIGAGESVNFHQPNNVSVVWNRILDANPSQIWGSLNANGQVVLMNQNGFYFGPNSSINVGGFFATTVPIAPESPAGGGLWQFNGTPPLASIINYGEIKAHSGGSVFLVAEKVENHGVLSAPDGTLGLYAGKEVLISERPDGRGLSASVKLPEGSIDNTGKLIADAGRIALHAAVVNNNGLVQANSVRERNGVIELVASEGVNLGDSSVLQARADGAAASDGGRISIKSDGRFADTPSSQIDVAGGVQGGNGGQVEISAARMASIQSRIDGHAQAGFSGGHLTIDPTDIVLSAGGDDSAGNGTINAGDPPDTLNLNVNAAFVGFSQILLQARRDISLLQNTVWKLNDSTGLSDPGSLLTLEAGRHILFGDGSIIAGGIGWSVRLIAGSAVADPLNTWMGVGSIYFRGLAANDNNSGAVETSDGSITLQAAHDILLGAGYVRAIGGGAIGITTGDGDVDAGRKADSYIFSRTGYTISNAGLGGIGTTAGGDVTIQSGRDISSFTPIVGAYGGGNVNLTAAGRVLGKYLVRDGIGTIRAGTDVGSPSSPASLSLIKGGWEITDARDIYLNEVLNPTGSLNSNRRTTGARVKFQFDYAPDAFAHFTARNSVQLLGTSPGRLADNSDRLPIYPPQLEIHAGAGGVVLGNDLVLYPSALSRLEITTTGGGSLRSTPGSYFQFVMSDSGSPDYRTFAADHALTPLQAIRPDDSLSVMAEKSRPALLNISGNIENLFLRTSKRADMLVYGNGVNFTFEGQNLSPNDGRDNSPLFAVGEFLDLARLVAMLNQPSDAVSAYLRNNLSEATRAALSTFAGASSDPLPIQEALVKDLNRIVRGQSIYQDILAVGVSLRPETQSLKVQLTDHPERAFQPAFNLVALNRMLLEDAFPLAVLKKHPRRPFDDSPFNDPNANYSGLWVKGDFSSRSDRTSATIDQSLANSVPDFSLSSLTLTTPTSVFDPAITINAELGRRLTYNPDTGKLGIQGRMLAGDLAFLLNPMVRKVDELGRTIFDEQGEPVLVPAIFTSDHAALQKLYDDSQNIPSSAVAFKGLQIGGSGEFNLAARNLDLGISQGIRSVGPQLNPFLTSVSLQGARLGIGLVENLDMTSSQIASYNGGAIDLMAGGTLNIGAQEQFTSDDTPKGIYSGHGGAVSVRAQGNININGSRIATYDGGDISVITDHGSIDAGSGGKGFFSVTTSQIDPATGQLGTRNDKFFGSGIVALTRTDSDVKVGDITVSAGMMNPPPDHSPGHDSLGLGSIVANAGGVLQLAFNDVDQSAAKVTLTANGSIKANQSGILGGNVALTAGEGIEGLIVAQGNLGITAQQNVNVTALAGGSANVTGGGTVSGSIVGGSGASVTGAGAVTADVISTGSAGSTGNAFKDVAAPVATQTTTESEKKAIVKTDDEDEVEKKRRAAAAPVLAKTSGRVTVILPKTQ